MTIFITTNSAPNSDVSIVSCLLENHWIITVFKKTKNPERDLIVVFLLYGCYQHNHVGQINFPIYSGALGVMASFNLPYKYFRLHSLNSFIFMAGQVGSNAILNLYSWRRNVNTCKTASNYPSLGMDICDAIIDTSVIISNLPIYTIHLIIPIKDWYQDAMSWYKAGVSSISIA